MPKPSDPVAFVVQRPHRADAARNFDALLLSARTAFAVHGSQASLEDIAADAGVGIGTLYRNFPTRQHLFNAIYTDEIESLRVLGLAVAELSPWEALASWLRRFVNYETTKLAMQEGIDKSSELFRAGRESLYAAGEPLLERAQLVQVVRPDVALNDILRLVIGISRGLFETDDQFEKIFKIALDGLRPPR